MTSPSAPRLQLDRGELLHARLHVPHPEAADRAALPQAPHPHDAQVLAATPRVQIVV